MTLRRAVLVDASVYVFRAWHSMPDEIADDEGRPLNAVHGFARFLLDLLERERPAHVAVAFDEALESSFRNDFYPAYKANREPAPEQLRFQFSCCMDFARALGLCVLSDPRFEADDLIGTLVMRMRSRGFGALIVSADKDLSQLLGEHDQQWDFARDQRWDQRGVLDRHGVDAHQIADFLGLAGDSVDNSPGVPGIGKTTAAALLRHFGSLDALLERVEELPFLRGIRGAAAHATRLRAHREQALLSRRLATIACDAPLPDDIGEITRRPVARDELDRVLERLRFGPLTRRRAQAQLIESS